MHTTRRFAGKQFRPQVTSAQRAIVAFLATLKPKTQRGWRALFSILTHYAFPLHTDQNRQMRKLVSARFCELAAVTLASLYIPSDSNGVERSETETVTSARGAAFESLMDSLMPADNSDTVIIPIFDCPSSAHEWFAAHPSVGLIEATVPFDSLKTTIDTLITLAPPGLRAIQKLHDAEPAASLPKPLDDGFHLPVFQPSSHSADYRMCVTVDSPHHHALLHALANGAPNHTAPSKSPAEAKRAPHTSVMDLSWKKLIRASSALLMPWKLGLLLSPLRLSAPPPHWCRCLCRRRCAPQWTDAAEHRLHRRLAAEAARNHLEPIPAAFR
jgi:hypothetical protein